jgi:hypothetical protein
VRHPAPNRSDQLSRCDKTTATLHGQEVEITKCPPRYAEGASLSKSSSRATHVKAGQGFTPQLAELSSTPGAHKKRRKRKKKARCKEPLSDLAYRDKMEYERDLAWAFNRKDSEPLQNLAITKPSGIVLPVTKQTGGR